MNSRILLNAKKLFITSSFLLISIASFSKIKVKTDTSRTEYAKNLALADTFYFKGKWEKAIPYYKKALKDTSTNALLWQRLAYANYMAEKLDDALSYYKKSLIYKPNPVLTNIIFTNILNIYEKQNKPNDAVAFLKDAADKGFNNLALIDTTKFFKPFTNDNAFKEVYHKVLGNAYPCLIQPHFSDFDYWVGEWDVYVTGTNNLVGKSVITKEDGACSIHEFFKSLVSPQSGNSISYYNTRNQKWEQLYVGSGGGNTFYTDGEYKDGKMHFKYNLNYNGTLYPGNFIFYNNGPNEVRQYQDYTLDGGKTFQVGYDFTYKRTK
jgi:tetratricopeptide (TPR) repeat protein